MKAIILLACLLAGLTSSLSAFAADKEVLLLTSEYPPWHSEQLPQQGIIPRIVREAFARSGYRVSFRFRPFARSLREAKAGLADGIVSLWYSKDRARYFLFSDPLTANLIGFIGQMQEPFDPDRLATLRSRRIGIVRDYDNPVSFRQAALNTETTTDDAQSVAMLVSGRLDLILIDRATGLYLLRRNHPDKIGNFHWLSPPLEQRQQFIGFSRRAENHQQKLQAFNRGLAALKAKGRIEAILHEEGYLP